MTPERAMNDHAETHLLPENVCRMFRQMANVHPRIWILFIFLSEKIGEDCKLLVENYPECNFESCFKGGRARRARRRAEKQLRAYEGTRRGP